jgi:HTH-type transcriptional regulator/antitoxin HigA
MRKASLAVVACATLLWSGAVYARPKPPPQRGPTCDNTDLGTRRHSLKFGASGMRNPAACSGASLKWLVMLAHRYEREREPLPELDPIEAIKFRMDQQGLSRRDLLGIFGTTARVSEVLNGRRPLTLDMIRKLHGELGIPLESLIRPVKAAVGTKQQRARPKRSRRHAA